MKQPRMFIILILMTVLMMRMKIMMTTMMIMLMPPGGRGCHLSGNNVHINDPHDECGDADDDDEDNDEPGGRGCHLSGAISGCSSPREPQQLPSGSNLAFFWNFFVSSFFQQFIILT